MDDAADKLHGDHDLPQLHRRSPATDWIHSDRGHLPSRQSQEPGFHTPILVSDHNGIDQLFGPISQYDSVSLGVLLSLPGYQRPRNSH